MTRPPASEERIGSDWYDRSAYFDSGEHLHDFGSRFQRYRVRKVLEIHTPAPGDRVLDLGCGWGTITFALAPRVGEVVGLDFSQRAVEGCNKRLERLAGRRQGPAGGQGAPGPDPSAAPEGASAATGGIRFRVGDARRTGMDAESFDVVVAADLFEHLYPDDSREVAAEAFRLLRPGGVLSVWTPCRSHILEVLKNNDVVLKRDPSHVDYKSMPRMRRIVTRAGFEVERAYFAESHLPGLSAVERIGQRWLPLLRRRIAVLGRKPG